MKILKTRYDYIFLIYVPIALFSIILALFFPNILLHLLQHTMTLCVFLALILIFVPYGKKRILQPVPRDNKLRWLSRVLGLQITLYLAFYGFAQALLAVFPETTNSPSITIQATYFFWQGGFYPWPFYVIVAIALIYLAPTSENPATIRVANRPILKKLMDGIIGYGLELFLKQGLMITIAMTLAINVLQFYHLIRLPFDLPLLSDQYTSLLFLSFLLLFLLMAPMTQRSIRHLYDEERSPFLILSGYCTFTFLIIVIFEFILKQITPYFPAVIPSFSLFNLRNIQHGSTFTQWLLLNISWWIAWTPLVAKILAQQAKGHRIREFVLISLLFPFLLGLSGSLLDYYTHGDFFIILGKYLDPWPIKLLFTLFSLIFIIKLFCDPEKEGLIEPLSSHQKAQCRSRMTFIQSLLQLTTALLIIYLFSHITLIVLLAIGIIVPVYLSSIIACFSALRKRLPL